MLENAGKVEWLIVSGNKRDKFLSWLKRICPEYKLWYFKDAWCCKHSRYRKFLDKNRYPDEKFLKAQRNALPIYIEFKISKELATVVYFSVLTERNQAFMSKFLTMIKDNFKANIHSMWANGNIDLKNLIIRYGIYFSIDMSMAVLIENTMKG